MAEFGEIREALRKANKLWFPLCLAGLVAAYAGYILGYRDVARVGGGPVLPYWMVTRVVAAGFGAQLVGSSVGALAVQFWALRRAGAGLHESARRVLGLNALEWAVLGGFAAVSGALVLAGLGPQAPLGMALGWLLVVPACAAGAVWFGSPRRSRRLTEVADNEPARPGRSPRAWLFWLGVKLRKGLADGIGAVVVIRELFRRPLRYAAGILGFPLYWSGHLLVLYGALRAFTGEHVPLVGLVLAFATGYVATSLPLPAGGSGAIESAIAFSLHAVGIELAPALLGVLVYRFSFWAPVCRRCCFCPHCSAFRTS